MVTASNFIFAMTTRKREMAVAILLMIDWSSQTSTGPAKVVIDAIGGLSVVYSSNNNFIRELEKESIFRNSYSNSNTVSVLRK